MANAVYLEEFIPTREQFDLSLEAEWRHAKFADAPEQHWRFLPSTKSHQLFTTFPIGEPDAKSPVPVECWREEVTLPELFGDEPISCLCIKQGEDEWVFARGVFYRVREEVIPDELS